jgi:acyl-CoA reductase-like NAD-dependent aldehyde dehydrogenase
MPPQASGFEGRRCVMASESIDRPSGADARIKAGVIGVNNYAEGDLTTPFGGFRQSGFGGHDKSVHAHDQYTELKTIWIDMTES